MVKIRLKRLGYKRNPVFRVVVINGREKREGRPIEELGYYNPKRKELKLDKEKTLEWVKKGAQPTETVQYLINNCDENGGLVRKETEDKKLSKKAQAKIEAAAKAKADEEAKAKAEAEAAAKAKADEEAKTKAEAEAAKAAPVVETDEEVAEETTEEITEEKAEV
jgi:small subunit ribosomal protein S16